MQFEYRVGKLSETDYQKTKQDLQKELAGVLAEVDRVKQRWRRVGKPPIAPAEPLSGRIDNRVLVCPSCGAKFEKQLKFCGECGKPMKAVQRMRAGIGSSFCLICALPGACFAAVTGTVVNRTTGQPAAAAPPSASINSAQAAWNCADQAKTDAQGNFTIDREPDGARPTMLRVEIDGVTYNHMLPPGTPATGLTSRCLQRFRQPGARQSLQAHDHVPAFRRADDGQRDLPDRELRQDHVVRSQGRHSAVLSAGGGQGQGRGARHRARRHVRAGALRKDFAAPDVYAAKFEIKPGETRFDLNYTVPYTEGAPYAGKIVTAGRKHAT